MVKTIRRPDGILIDHIGCSHCHYALSFEKDDVRKDHHISCSECGGDVDVSRIIPDSWKRYIERKYSEETVDV